MKWFRFFSTVVILMATIAIAGQVSAGEADDNVLQIIRAGYPACDVDPVVHWMCTGLASPHQKPSETRHCGFFVDIDCDGDEGRIYGQVELDRTTNQIVNFNANAIREKD